MIKQEKIKIIFKYLITAVLLFVIISLLNTYLVLKPRKIYSDLTPTMFNLPAEDIQIETEDDITLSGWYIPSPLNEQVIIFLHGYPAEKSDLLPIAAEFYPDFSLLLMDLRYFGQSDGEFTTLGVREVSDLSQTVTWLENRGYEKIGVFGLSLGGAIAIKTARVDERISAIATYGTFADLRQLGQEIYRLPLIGPAIVEMMIVWSRLYIGESPADISPSDSARYVTQPVWLSHSRADEQINFRHAEKLRESLNHNSQGEFYFFPSLPHGAIPADYTLKLKGFFQKHLE